MGLRLHSPDATKAVNLQELFQELGELEEAAGSDRDRDFFQVELPDAKVVDGKLVEEEDMAVRAARAEIRSKVIALFAGSMIGLKDGQDGRSVCRSYTRMPGEATGHFDAGDLLKATEDIGKLLDPDDPDFSAAVADPEVGVLTILGKTVNLAASHGDPHAAFKQLQQVASAARIRITAIKAPGVEDFPAGWSIERPLVQLPWDSESEDRVSRKDVLADRVREMDRVDIAASNGKLFEDIIRRFPTQQVRFREILGEYRTACSRCDLSRYQRAQFLNVLLGAILRGVKTITPQACSRLDALKKVLTGTKTEAEIAAAIDGFAQTLPAESKATKGSKGEASEASGPAAETEKVA